MDTIITYINGCEMDVIITKSNVSGGSNILLTALSHTLTFRTGSGQQIYSSKVSRRFGGTCFIFEHDVMENFIRIQLAHVAKVWSRHMKVIPSVFAAFEK